MEITNFSEYLINSGLSKNTINSYCYSVSNFTTKYPIWNKQNLLAHRDYLVTNLKPNTVNLRIHGINKYLDFIQKPDLKLSFIKIQQRSFLENIISDYEYLQLKNHLLTHKNKKWYFIIVLLGTSGVRISELLQISVIDITVGYMDLYSKCGKIRRVYFLDSLCRELLLWLNSERIYEGNIFLNKNRLPITARGISYQLKKFSAELHIRPDKIHPHSFRHYFAKKFLQKSNDLAMLADILGHSSIETTRIYLRKTSDEQHNIINQLVTW